MKTPMQELIETIKKLQKDDDVQPFMWHEQIIKLAESMLEKEKEVIQQAFYEGMLCQGFDPNMGRAEMYYNEVYKNNE